MSLLKSFASGFTHLFFPRVCAVCQTDLMKGERVLCSSCFYKLPLTRFWEDPENPVAQTFWGRVSIESASAYFFFAKGSKYRPLLHDLKYKGKYEVGVILGEAFGQVLAKEVAYQGLDLIVPVPLHPKKQRIRGYNQAEAIARGLGQGMGIEVLSHVLIRSEFTETQTKKTRVERVRNVENAFMIIDPKKLENKHVLLVDDVITTGATMEVCATQLLTVFGCKVSVCALAFAGN